MVGMFWEEWEIGAEFQTASRTITEADVVNFAGISGDYNPLHIDEEFCKQTQFGTRIAHGPLVYSIAAGLLFQLLLYDDTLIASAATTASFQGFNYHGGLQQTVEDSVTSRPVIST